MKKLAAVSLISLVLAGCVNPGKASVQTDQLENHRFVLENVDGKAVKGGKRSLTFASVRNPISA